MSKYIIKYNIGYGTSAEVIEADNKEKAEKIAYEIWRDACEDNADYSTEEYTQEEAENYGIADD